MAQAVQPSVQVTVMNPCKPLVVTLLEYWPAAQMEQPLVAVESYP